MIKLNTYILEKLKLNKNINNQKANYQVDDICLLIRFSCMKDRGFKSTCIFPVKLNNITSTKITYTLLTLEGTPSDLESSSNFNQDNYYFSYEHNNNRADKYVILLPQEECLGLLNEFYIDNFIITFFDRFHIKNSEYQHKETNIYCTYVDYKGASKNESLTRSNPVYKYIKRIFQKLENE